MPDQNKILLQTKLHPPRLPKDLITRSRLVEQLNRDIDHHLFLVCAPAGFGKTTLICNWFRHMAAGQGEQGVCLPSVWLSLDEKDSDLSLFLRYFIAALRMIFSDACAETLALVNAQQHPPNTVIFATLSNELDALPGECILALDDYHTINGIEVHDLISELSHHWPRPLHLVLISRINPPILLSRLRAKGMLSEIRTRDLRFTTEEMAAFLRQSQSPQLSQNALALLEERFEGWPAGLKLAILSLRAEGSQEAVLSALSRENSNIIGYLVDEVLTHQFPAIQTFLLKTSILDRFCASLCEAVIGESDPAWTASACLKWIEHSQLFLESLDDQREWYRYHHLFKELLEQRLTVEMTPDQVSVLHLRVSAWFEEQGLIDEALNHALAAGDVDLVARLMHSGLREVLNRQDRPTLERWLHLLPEEVIQKHPELLLVRAWAMEFSWRLNMQAQVIHQIEEILNSGWATSISANELQILRGQIILIKAQHAYFSNQNALAIDLSQKALTLLPLEWKFARGASMLFLSLSMHANGQAAEAKRLLLDEYGFHDDKADTYTMYILESLGFIYYFTGQLEQSRRIAQVLHKGVISSGMGVMKSWADWFLGVASYQQNNLEDAAHHFTQIFENRYIAQISAYRDAVAGLALIHQIRGKSTEAWQMVASISQFDLEHKGSEDERTRSLRARLMLLQGDLDSAYRWASTFNTPPLDQPIIWLEEPQVTRVRVLVASGTDADLQSALKILDVLAEIVERTHNTSHKIEILALRTLALNALGDAEGANAVLMQALDLAQPGGFIRVFVDLGNPMRAMLQRHLEQGHSLELTGRILAAFQDDNYYLSRSAIQTHPGYRTSLSNSKLIDPLTPRELEVLTLLQGPLSIREIALNLNITYATAKRHTINIYAKLNANQRWEAVVRAVELNILPPS